MGGRSENDAGLVRRHTHGTRTQSLGYCHGRKRFSPANVLYLYSTVHVVHCGQRCSPKLRGTGKAGVNSGSVRASLERRRRTTGRRDNDNNWKSLTLIFYVQTCRKGIVNRGDGGYPRSSSRA
eukprot:Pompholyxophrys_punicea_v1_NODE_162_length_3055_cov_4.636000.p4 type:complete len:123 gc:universal NODE_162_length_3055_cov_4.636000:770-402(-)